MDGLDSWLVASIAVKWLVYLSALLASGGVWFLASQPALPSGVRHSKVPVVVVAALIGGAATLLQICVQAGQMIDEGWGGMIELDMLTIAIEGPLGISSWMRLAGLALILTLPAFDRRLPWSAIIGAVLVAGSFAMTGHVTREPHLVLAVLLTAHIAAASFWFGALWPLYRLATHAETLSDAAKASEQFGRAAAWTVALLVSCGAALAWLLAGSFDVLFGTLYGWTLLAKVGFVGLLLGLAAANKWRLAPALSGTDPHSAALAASALRWSIKVEFALFFAILLATAILTRATELP